MLVATEMFAYGEEMFRPIPAALRWLPVRSPIQQRHALLRHLIQLFWSAVILLGTAAAAQWLLPGLIGPTPTDWVSGIAVGVFCVLAVVDTALLPFAWRYQANERAKVRSLMLKMTATYGELADNGVVSTRRLREVAASAADAGVAWPGALFAVLDDNISRIGKL